MTDDESDIYRKLQKHLDKFPIGFPATTTGIELKVLRRGFAKVLSLNEIIKLL